MLQLKQNRPFCLASSSPRRQTFMENYGFQFECHSPDIDETQKSGEPVEDFVLRMAEEKAEQVEKTVALPDNTIILAGDTSVFLEGKVLGKPDDETHAKKMLQELSGKTHQVYSGFTLFDCAKQEAVSGLVVTEVLFQQLSAETIQWYVNTGEPSDKAGAYSIQGLGTVLVDSIRGSYNNVVGFPMERIFPIMHENKWISFE